MDERQSTRLILRVQDLNQFLQPLPAHGGTHLDAYGIGNAAEILDVGPLDRGRAHSDPRHVRGQVVPLLLPLDVTGLRLFGQEVQALVAGVEIASRGGVNPQSAHGFEEFQRFGDRIDDSLVGLAQRRLVQEAQVPVLGVMQVGEPAVDQRPHEVQRERGALVAAQQQLRIRLALLD